jgi:hypothetical protein
MDGTRFDRLTRGLTDTATRRGILAGLAATALGLTAPHVPIVAKKKNKKTKKQKPLKLNQFDCVNVGGKCQGEDANCCSGKCQGKKPKKSKKDTSRCAAHHVGGCTVERDVCIPDNAALARCNPANDDAFCTVTTGNGPFCANLSNTSEEDNCRACSTDGDCIVVGFPPGSACVSMTGAACAEFGVCTTESGGRMCLPPGS